MDDETMNNEDLENTGNNNQGTEPENPTAGDPINNNEDLENTGNNNQGTEPENPTDGDPINNNEESNNDTESKKKAKAAYVALRYVGVTPPSL